ncbi:MAG: hypothetical protein OEY89_14345 [Gammaproteobacteria bacterium]|nr:hypothetical protein [Gammaproteobacteria bacterium]
MIVIDHLSLSLPGELRYRGETLARLIAHELSLLQVHKTTYIEQISLPAITVNPKSSDLYIAQQVAAQVYADVNQRGQRHA